ncbi:S8 family serine peptidase [Dokdonia sinensis]|nr:S8 family serine peptidase [Dokdonia sinensis]
MKYLFPILFILPSLIFAQEGDYAADRLILKFKEKYSSSEIKSLIQAEEFQLLNDLFDVQSLRNIGSHKTNDTYVLSFALGNYEINEIASFYKGLDYIKFVENDFTMTGAGRRVSDPNDPLFESRQWSMNNEGTFSLSPATQDADIDMLEAWEITTGDPDLIIGVIDSGLRLNHPEFENRIWINNAETEDGLDSDNNGYVDDIYGWDFVNEDSDPTDDHGHGTNVTSILGMTGNNDIGYAGVNWNSKIMTIKALDSNNSGFYSSMIEAIYYAVDNGCDVINMSIGGNSSSTALEAAINYCYSQDVPIVISTGNQDGVIQYPAQYENSIAVGSTNPDDSRSSPFFWSSTSGSNYGPALDYVAPGNYIYGAKYDSDTNYNTYWGGTSQGAPHVAGVISLLKSLDPNLTVDEINNILIATSQDEVGPANEDTPGFDNFFGHGRINAHDALQNASLSIVENNLATFPVYPNPIASTGVLRIGTSEKLDLKIINSSGQQVLERIQYQDSNNGLKIPRLISGLYILQITNGNGNSHFKKLIVK